MAYDEDLAARVRELFVAEPDLVERKMFGGLAFLLGGHMTVAVSGSGGLMVRLARDDADRLALRTPAEPVVMQGRPMGGWLLVPVDALKTGRQLERWVTRATTYVRALPPKPH
ncbi:MAG: TfoX/Sxy family protein [Acidimicrobiales bacterium]|nr:TfoX/Sxy family protein [Acidimicrobiales bacterium]